MPNLTLAIPEELKKKMESVPEMNWSEIAREAISKQLEEYKLFKELVSKSKLTEKNAKKLADEIDRKIREAVLAGKKIPKEIGEEKEE